MSVPIDCFRTIVGLSRASDSCVTGNYPSDFDESKSNLFISELNGITLKVFSSLPDFWNKLEYARENAVRSSISDLIINLLKYNKKKREDFKGNIGGFKSKANINVTSTYAGNVIRCSDVSTGVLKINGINTIFGNTTSFTIDIYNNRNYELIGSYTLNTNAGKVQQNTLNIELPMRDEYNEPMEYYLVYNKTGLIIRDTVYESCGGCGTHFCFDRSSECFRKASQKERWKQWILVAGISGSDLTYIEDWGISSYNYGLILDVEISCSIKNILCDDNSDFAQDENQVALAYMILYKSGDYFMDEMIKTDEITRSNMISSEQLLANKTIYTDKYKEMLEFASRNWDVSKTDCLICNPKFNLARARQNI